MFVGYEPLAGQAPWVTDGVVVIEFGNEANAAIDTLTVTLTPYETSDGSIVWRCGTAPVPGGGALSPMGTAGGGTAATYIAPTVPDQYLPASCRP